MTQRPFNLKLMTMELHLPFNMTSTSPEILNRWTRDNSRGWEVCTRPTEKRTFSRLPMFTLSSIRKATCMKTDYMPRQVSTKPSCNTNREFMTTAWKEVPKKKQGLTTSSHQSQTDSNKWMGSIQLITTKSLISLSSRLLPSILILKWVEYLKIPWHIRDSLLLNQWPRMVLEPCIKVPSHPTAPWERPKEVHFQEQEVLESNKEWTTLLTKWHLIVCTNRSQTRTQ